MVTLINNAFVEIALICITIFPSIQNIDKNNTKVWGLYIDNVVVIHSLRWHAHTDVYSFFDIQIFYSTESMQ